MTDKKKTVSEPLNEMIDKKLNGKYSSYEDIKILFFSLQKSFINDEYTSLFIIFNKCMKVS